MNAMLYKLTQLDFAIIDLKLYLDTHPSDGAALAEYNKLTAEAERIRGDYESKNGPLTATKHMSDGTFGWVNDPWPWEEKFN